VLTSVREPQTLGPSSGTGDELTDLKRGLEASTGALRLPQQAVRRRSAIKSKQALRDMRLPTGVKELLTGLLHQLHYALDEIEVSAEYDANDVRWISVARSGDDTRHLLHIPRAVLNNESNKAEFSLLQHIFSNGALIYIISPKSANFPRQVFASIAKLWQGYDNKRVYFINWSWLNDLAGPNPDLKRFAELFEPPLASRANGGPSSVERPTEGDHEYVAVLPREQTSTGFSPGSGGGGDPNAMVPGLNLRKLDKDWIVSELADLAANTPPDPKLYYRDLVARAGLPRDWTNQLSGTWTGNAPADARRLIDFALSRGVNPSDARYTTLGSLLTALLEDQGLDRQNRTVALIYAYKLYSDRGLLTGLAARYQLPIPAPEQAIADQAHPSPEFVLRERLDDVELQGLLTREPDFLDVGFLSRAIERAASICRVEAIDGEPLGTGFLVAPQMLLTNYHVVDFAPGKDLEEKAANLQLRFRSVTAAAGRESEGKPYRPDPSRPLLRSSPVGALDYALIQVEEGITRRIDVAPSTYTGSQPLRKGMGLNILGHPQGGPMKLAVSGNGVAGVYSDAGLVQYATRALNGSSGSPCFDDDWQPVAIHHAERATPFGSVREGILLGPIFDEIRSLL
jgi:V8-like Glu-specific endopeptidase